MIIGLSGYARSGKDTVAEILVNDYNFTRVAFADAIRDILYDMNVITACSPTGRVQDAVDRVGWDEAKQDTEVRRQLQNLGVAARKHMGEHIWVKTVLNKIFENPYQDYVITDVRFKNEAEYVKSCEGHMWRVVRPYVFAVNDHISEVDLDDYKFDAYVHNNSDLNGLKTTVDFHMEELRHDIQR